MRKTPDTEAVEMLLRALYEGTASDCPWVRNWSVAGEMEELAYHRATDALVPYQYLLITLASDQTRDVTRRTARAVRRAADHVLELLDRYHAARQGQHPGWAKLIALLEAPFPISPPADGDLRDPDVVAVIVRETAFDGSWTKTLCSLSQDGLDARWPIDRARVQQLAAFEEAYQVNLADLLLPPAPGDESG